MKAKKGLCLVLALRGSVALGRGVGSCSSGVAALAAAASGCVFSGSRHAASLRGGGFVGSMTYFLTTLPYLSQSKNGNCSRQHYISLYIHTHTHTHIVSVAPHDHMSERTDTPYSHTLCASAVYDMAFLGCSSGGSYTMIHASVK